MGIKVHRQKTIECGSCHFCSDGHTAVSVLTSDKTSTVRICDKCLIELKVQTENVKVKNETHIWYLSKPTLDKFIYDKHISPRLGGKQTHPATYIMKVREDVLTGFWWYRNLLDITFTVRNCTKEDSTVGMEHFDYNDLYIVDNGDYMGNAIVKAHCERAYHHKN